MILDQKGYDFLFQQVEFTGLCHHGLVPFAVPGEAQRAEQQQQC